MATTRTCTNFLVKVEHGKLVTHAGGKKCGAEVGLDAASWDRHMEAGICASYKELVDNQTKVLPDRFHSHAPRAIDPVAISKSVLLPTAASHRPQPARGEKGGAQAGATASSAIIICDSPPAGGSAQVSAVVMQTVRPSTGKLTSQTLPPVNATSGRFSQLPAPATRHSPANAPAGLLQPPGYSSPIAVTPASYTGADQGSPASRRSASSPIIAPSPMRPDLLAGMTRASLSASPFPSRPASVSPMPHVHGLPKSRSSGPISLRNSRQSSPGPAALAGRPSPLTRPASNGLSSTPVQMGGRHAVIHTTPSSSNLRSTRSSPNLGPAKSSPLASPSLGPRNSPGRMSRQPSTSPLNLFQLDSPPAGQLGTGTSKASSSRDSSPRGRRPSIAPQGPENNRPVSQPVNKIPFCQHYDRQSGKTCDLPLDTKKYQFGVCLKHMPELAALNPRFRELMRTNYQRRIREGKYRYLAA